MKTALTDQIEQVERRIELRRERTVRHFDEVSDDVSRAARWLPLAFTILALVIGFSAGRRPRPRAVSTAMAPSRGILATLLAVGATGLRLAASKEVRGFVGAMRKSRKPDPRS